MGSRRACRRLTRLDFLGVPSRHACRQRLMWSSFPVLRHQASGISEAEPWWTIVSGSSGSSWTFPVYGRSGFLRSSIAMSIILHTIKSIIPTGKKGPPPPEDLFDLKKEYHRIRDELRQARVTNKDYHHELRRRTGELRQANRDVGHLQQECQRLKKSIKGLQNDLNNVHQQLEDAKTLSEVREKKLISAQIDTISISDSEVGEKVTALNEEIFQAAAILGEALVYNRQELSQRDLNAASAVSHEAVGEKMTNLLITRSQKSKPEINPLLVQVVLEILMVNFCISKLQSWYPGDSTIGEFLSAIYSGIHSTGKHRIDSKPSFVLTYSTF